MSPIGNPLFRSIQDDPQLDWPIREDRALAPNPNIPLPNPLKPITLAEIAILERYMRHWPREHQLNELGFPTGG